MSAFEEFRRFGALGHEGASLLYRTVRAVARIHRFPSPSRAPQWTTDDIVATAHDFLAAKGRDRLADIFVASVDEASLRRRLGAAVRNHLRDGARRTELGRLIKRLNEVLAADHAFRRVAGAGGGAAWWALTEGPDEPTLKSTAILATAANEVDEVTVPRWSESAQRRPPHADRASLVALCRGVLRAANGSCPVADIAKAIAPRLNLGPSPLSAEVDLPDHPDSELAAPGQSEETLDSMVAEAIFGRLSERERLIVAHWEESAREVSPLLGIGKSQAAASRQRVVDFLRRELLEIEQPDGVVRELMSKAQGWIAGRTEHEGGPSSYSDGSE